MLPSPLVFDVDCTAALSDSVGVSSCVFICDIVFVDISFCEGVCIVLDL